MIFAANHHSHLDTPLLLTSIPEPWRHQVVVGAAADYFFEQPRHGGARRRWRSAPSRSSARKVTRRSADQAAELIDDGWSLLIFPEGGRSPDGWGQPFRGGAAYLADAAAACRWCRSTSRAPAASSRKGTKRPTPGRTPVTFGTPLRPSDGESTPPLRRRASSAPSPRWPTRPPPTGGRPAGGPTPATTPPLDRPRRPAPGAGPGRSATATGRARQRRRWPKV